VHAAACAAGSACIQLKRAQLGEDVTSGLMARGDRRYWHRAVQLSIPKIGRSFDPPRPQSPPIVRLTVIRFADQ
jgi:hypothetical protein